LTRRRGHASFSGLKTGGGNTLAVESILRVEDNGIQAAHMQDCQARLGNSILDTDATGEDANAVMEERQADLILMDISLAGELNGITAAERIRSSSDVPIVFLTGYFQKDLIPQTKTVRPTGYLIKLVHVRKLQATIL
jgi:CheY-like chemotaxis protein